MRRLAFLGATCLGIASAIALAAHPSEAAPPAPDPADSLDCHATERNEPARRAEVEEQERLVDLLNQHAAAAKDKVDQATTARDAAFQKFAQEGGGDGGAGDAGASAQVQSAAADLRDALIAWHKADSAAKCGAKELAERTTSYKRSLLYAWAVEPTAVAAVGAGGAHRIGGSLLVSVRDKLFFSEVQFGLSFNSLQGPPPPLGAKSPGPNPPDAQFATQLPIRVYFGDSPVGLFLGAAPSWIDRRQGGGVGAIAPQGGLRVRGLTKGSCMAVFDAKLFAEPWFFLDGATTAVLFGIEVGIGVGGKGRPDDVIEWKSGPKQDPADP